MSRHDLPFSSSGGELPADRTLGDDSPAPERAAAIQRRVAVLQQALYLMTSDIVRVAAMLDDDEDSPFPNMDDPAFTGKRCRSRAEWRVMINDCRLRARELIAMIDECYNQLVWLDKEEG